MCGRRGGSDWERGGGCLRWRRSQRAEPGARGAAASAVIVLGGSTGCACRRDGAAAADQLTRPAQSHERTCLIAMVCFSRSASAAAARCALLCVAAVVSWVLIYRTESYGRLKKAIDALQARLDEKKKEQAAAALGKPVMAAGGAVESKDKLAKKVSALDEQLKERNRELSMSKMQSTVVVGLSMLLVFGLLNNLFEGVAVAKLPFEPFGLLRSMSHRGLSGSDYTDASVTFIYILCSLSVRANVQRFMGLTPKAAPGPSIWAPQTQ